MSILAKRLDNDRVKIQQRCPTPAIKLPVATLGTLAVVAAIACTPTLDPQAPTMPVTEEPVVSASYAHMPITVPISKLRAAAEEVLPRTLEAAPFNHNEQGGPDAPACGWNAGYKVERDPLAISGSGNRLTTTLDVRYRVTARKRVPCPGPIVTGSCGFDDEWPRTASARIGTSLSVAPDWSAQIKTTLEGVSAGNKCKVTFLNIDVTSRIIGFFGKKLDDMTSRLDHEAKVSLALDTRVSSLWTKLQEPIALGNDAWLVMDPENLALQPIAADQSEIKTGVRVTAFPRVVLGEKPAPGSRPLPASGNVGAGSAFNVLLPVHLQHAALRDQLRKALRIEKDGILFPPTGDRQIRIVDADLYGYGRQAVVWLKFDGSAKGEMYFSATPTYNAATNVLSFPDLEYDVNTKNLILKVMDWFKHDEFRSYLRGKAVFSLAKQVGGARERLVAALNRVYGDVTLTGTVDSLVLLGFFGKPDEANFTAYLQSNGTLSLAVR